MANILKVQNATDGEIGWFQINLKFHFRFHICLSVSFLFVYGVLPPVFKNIFSCFYVKYLHKQRK